MCSSDLPQPVPVRLRINGKVASVIHIPPSMTWQEVDEDEDEGDEAEVDGSSSESDSEDEGLPSQQPRAQRREGANQDDLERQVDKFIADVEQDRIEGPDCSVVHLTDARSSECI